MWYVAQVQAGRESATRDLCLRLVSPDVLEECFMPDYFTAFATPFQTSLLQCSTVG